MNDSKKNTHPIHVLVLIVLWAITHLFLFWHYGIRELYDARGYVQGADYVLAHGEFEDVHHVFYAVPILCVAFFRALFPGEILPFLMFQSMLSGLGMLALYRSANLLFKNHWAGLVAGLIFLFWWDNIHWNTTAMTESMACSFICFVVYFLMVFKGRVRDYAVIGGLMGFGFFIRPTYVIAMVGALAFLLNVHWGVLKGRPGVRFSVIVFLFIACGIGAMMMFSHWDFTEQYKEGNVVTYIDRVKGSALYHESLQVSTEGLSFQDSGEAPVLKMAKFIVGNPIIFFKAALLKTWYLLSATRPYYTRAHNGYSLVWVTVIYGLFYFGWRESDFSPIRYFVGVSILANVALVGMATVDWDNRFYIPMEPGIVLMAGGGAVALFHRLKKAMEKDAR